MTDTCAACFKAIEGKPIECDYCHSQDEKWCSSICQSSVGWYQHEPHCNVLHVNGLIATPYAWQNMTSNWQEQKHAFPAYLLREKISPIQSRQTVVPAVTQRSEMPEAKESKTKPHPFQLKINGELLGSFSAPDNMISEYSANAAARELASSRNTQLHEGRTYWVGDKDMSKNVTILPGKVNEFQLVRGQSGDEHTVRVHVFEDSLKHFTEQVGDRLGHGLKRHLKSQYKNKGINDKASATFFGINADTKDAVTFTVDKEMQLLDLEFYTPKTPSAIKLQQQTFDHSFDDRNETDIQALIMASQDLPEAQPHLDTLVEYHRNLTTKNPEMIAEDVQMLIRARASINAVVDVLKQNQELIGRRSYHEWVDWFTSNPSDEKINQQLMSWAKAIYQTQHYVDALQNEESERKGWGFRRKLARGRGAWEKRHLDSYKKQISDFLEALENSNLRTTRPNSYTNFVAKTNSLKKFDVESAFPEASEGWILKDPKGLKKNQGWKKTGQRIGFEIPKARFIGVGMTYATASDEINKIHKQFTANNMTEDEFVLAARDVIFRSEESVQNTLANDVIKLIDAKNMAEHYPKYRTAFKNTIALTITDKLAEIKKALENDGLSQTVIDAFLILAEVDLNIEANPLYSVLASSGGPSEKVKKKEEETIVLENDDKDISIAMLLESAIYSYSITESQRDAKQKLDTLNEDSGNLFTEQIATIMDVYKDAVDNKWDQDKFEQQVKEKTNVSNIVVNWFNDANAKIKTAKDWKNLQRAWNLVYNAGKMFSGGFSGLKKYIPQSVSLGSWNPLTYFLGEKNAAQNTKKLQKKIEELKRQGKVSMVRPRVSVDLEPTQYVPSGPGYSPMYAISSLFPTYIAEHPSFDAYHTPASLSNDPEEVRRLRAKEPQLVSSKSSKYWDKYHDTDYTDF